MRYILGLIGVGVGFLVIWKSEWILVNFGRVDWAEEKFGMGGTRTFYKLIGLGIIIISFLYMGRVGGGLILRIFAPTLPR